MNSSTRPDTDRRQPLQARAEWEAVTLRRLRIALIPVVLLMAVLVVLAQLQDAASPEAIQKRIDVLEAEVARLPASDSIGNIRLYRDLLELAPDEVRYREKLARYEAQLQAEELAKQAEKVAAEAARDATFRRTGRHCLMGRTTHWGVKSYVLERLHDPSSFEHVSTTISPLRDGGHDLVMIYRARNGFGALTLGKAIARLDHKDCSGRVLIVQ